MFEALALTLAREMPVAACARILRSTSDALWRQIDAHVSGARAKESYANVKIIGIDETSCAKGHDYITLIHDLEQSRLIYATAGKDGTTIERFCQDLQTHQGKPKQSGRLKKKTRWTGCPDTVKNGSGLADQGGFGGHLWAQGWPG